MRPRRQPAAWGPRGGGEAWGVCCPRPGAPCGRAICSGEWDGNAAVPCSEPGVLWGELSAAPPVLLRAVRSFSGRLGRGETRWRWREPQREAIPPLSLPPSAPRPSPVPSPPSRRYSGAGTRSPPACRRSSCSSRWSHALPFSQSLTLWNQPARCNHPALLQASDGWQEKSPGGRPSRKPAPRRGGSAEIASIMKSKRRQGVVRGETVEKVRKCRLGCEWS